MAQSEKLVLPVRNRDKYAYYKVERKNVYEFDELRDVVLTLASKNETIPFTTINRLLSFLERETTEDFDLYELTVKLKSTDLEEYFIKHKKSASKFLFEEEVIPLSISGSLVENRRIVKIPGIGIHQVHGAFDFMIIRVLDQLLALRVYNFQVWDQDYCLKNAYKYFLKYKAEEMSPGQKEQYKHRYMLMTLAAVITEKVFGFPICEKNSNVGKVGGTKVNIQDDAAIPKEYYDKVKKRLKGITYP